MLKILVACANGAGTSLMMKMTAEKVSKSLNLDVANIHHCALEEGKNTAINYDIVFCPINFVDIYKDAAENGVVVIGLRNLLSDKEMTEKLQSTGLVEKNQKQ